MVCLYSVASVEHELSVRILVSCSGYLTPLWQHGMIHGDHSQNNNKKIKPCVLREVTSNGIIRC